jgi:predicted porin
MKKQLLSATALIAAGTLATVGAANALTISLGTAGYMEQVVGVVFDNDDSAGVGTGRTTATTSVVQFMESEVHFKGSGKLDNGIEIIADIQLEAGGSPGQIIDEEYAIVRGNFGQLILGMEDNAAYLMTIGYTGVFGNGVGLSGVYSRGDWIQNPAGIVKSNGGTTSVEQNGPDSDSNKISYFTPRFAGFQAGVSYIPTAQQQNMPTNSTTTGSGSGASTSGGIHAKDTVYSEGWALGLNYVGKFDNVGVGVAASYLTLNPPMGSPTFDPDNYRSWNAAGSVTVGPFKVAAGYKRVMNWDTAAGVSAEGNTYDVGGRYTFGPNAVSAVYIHGETKGTVATAGKDKDTGLTLSYARTLAPGVKVTGNLLYSELKDEAGGAGSKFDGWAFATTLRLDF